MQINCNKRKRLHKKRVQLPQYWFGTQTWPPFQCSRRPIGPPWRHVKTLNHLYGARYATTEDFLWLAVNCFLYLQQTKIIFLRLLYEIGIVWTVFVHQFPNLRKSLTEDWGLSWKYVSPTDRWISHHHFNIICNVLSSLSKENKVCAFYRLIHRSLE